MYENKYRNDPSSAANQQLFLGRLRCLHALGEWEQLSQLSHTAWAAAPADVRKEIAPLAACAAWNLASWDVSFFPSINVKYKADARIHRCNDWGLGRRKFLSSNTRNS